MLQEAETVNFDKNLFYQITNAMAIDDLDVISNGTDPVLLEYLVMSSLRVSIYEYN